MSEPQPAVEILPARAILPEGTEAVLDVLVRILPPRAPQDAPRPALNLGLVLDRSGSMQGDKLTYAVQAARYVVEQLLPTDRVSLTVFDHEVNTLVASTPATSKARLHSALAELAARGQTALHAGWTAGSAEVARHLQPGHLNRVLLLSDGQANAGETRAERIAESVRTLAALGVSTTTMGVGEDFNEDLLEGMALAGDGDYHFIASPEQLPAFFDAELRGLTATFGRKVGLRLGVPAGVEVVDVFNDFQRTADGGSQLPNLVAGRALDVGLRLRVPAGVAFTLDVELAWEAPRSAERGSLRCSLAVPRVSAEAFEKAPVRPDVAEAIALLVAARARREAMQRLDVGDFGGADKAYRVAGEYVAAMACSPEASAELDELGRLRTLVQEGRTALARKESSAQSFNRQRGKGRGKPDGGPV